MSFLWTHQGAQVERSKAIEFGLGRAKIHIDAGWHLDQPTEQQAARRQDGKKGKEVVVGESQGHVIQSVAVHHP